MSENFRPNVCGKSALQGSSRALYTPIDPTHKQCTWPVPFTRLGVLCWFELEQSWMVVCGLIWSGGLVWRWSNVGIGAWSDLWPDMRLIWLSVVVVWSGADLMDCRCGLVPWPNLEDWLRNMVCYDGWKWKRWEAEVILMKRVSILQRAT